MAINAATMSLSSSLAVPSSRRSAAPCTTSSVFDPLHSAYPSRLSSRSSRLESSFTSLSSAPCSFDVLSSARVSDKEFKSIWRLAASSGRGSQAEDKEEVFFDGGPHYGDLVTNVLFGFTLVWLPLTFASVFRALFLRYRFTNLRVTIISGLTGEDRKDFSYEVIKDVQYIPRFIGEWGDMVITLKDGTKVEMKCIPKFREISKYCLEKAGKKQDIPISSAVTSPASGPKGF